MQPAAGGGESSSTGAKLAQAFVRRHQQEMKTANKEQNAAAFDGDVLMSFDPADSQNVVCGCIGSTGTRSKVSAAHCLRVPSDGIAR